MIKVRVHEGNINTLKFKEPQDIEIFYFDSLFTCNIKCIYCHHYRNTNPVKIEDFKRFLDTQVNSIGEFSLGCGMEPTMDKRMVDFAEIVGSHIKKPRWLKLQTNGTILHHHDLDRLFSVGVNSVCFSLDSVDATVHKVHRGASDLDQIIKNIKTVREKLSHGIVGLMATVTRLSAPKLDEFLEFAVNNGINGVCIKKMYHYPENNMIKDHDWMRSMILTEEEFINICEPLKNKYKDKLWFIFEAEEKRKDNLGTILTKMQNDNAVPEVYS